MTTRAGPTPSGYGATTTAREVIGDPRLDGLIAIVTGGLRGRRARDDARAGRRGRDGDRPGARSLDKARAALAGIARVEIETLDLIDPASVDAFAARFLGVGSARCTSW